MPKRWERLQARPLEMRLEWPDQEPVEAMKGPPRPLSMREEMERYLKAHRRRELEEQHPLVAEELQDFLEEQDEERILSEYQLRVLAMELQADEEADIPEDLGSEPEARTVPAGTDGNETQPADPAAPAE